MTGAAPAATLPHDHSEPVLPGMYPDPSACRVGRDVYLVTSSFEYFPGIPIFRSRDLVRWTQLGHVLTRRRQLELAGVRSSGGIYAPTLRYHEGTFYVVTTHVERGNFFVAAARPGGPWSDPVWLDEDGVDPSLSFLDGRVYYTRNGTGSDADHPFIYQGELDLSESRARLRRRPRVIWRGTGGIWPEAPHLYRRGGWYYLVTAEGGTSYGHSVVVARSRRPYGPFEPSPHGPLLTHRDDARHPVQATGHADLVELEDGSTWALFLGIRPTGRHHHLGRETFLTPVDWGDDGWPRLGDAARAAGSTVPAAERDEFDGPRLGPAWVSVRNLGRGSRSLRERPGWLRLRGSAATLRDVASPTLVCRRQQHHDVVVPTVLDFEPGRDGERAGLCVRANEEFHVMLLVGRGPRGRELTLEQVRDGRTRVLGKARLGRGPVTLQLTATASRYAFSGGTGRRLHELGGIPTRAMSAETIHAATGRHHFTGAMIGLYATGSGRPARVPADFDWFELLPTGG
jgi:xylan 1,4-beta-xylosidase